MTPNRTVQLPGLPYDGDDPDGYLPRDEITAYLERSEGEGPACTTLRAGRSVLDLLGLAKRIHRLVDGQENRRLE